MALEDYIGAAGAGLAAAVPHLGLGAGLAAGLTGGINALGSLFGASSQAKREYKYTKKLMDYQNSLALKNWELQNEYNLPSNQMKRLYDAGLNPHLVYGGGATTLAANLTQPNAKHSGGSTPDFSGLASAQSVASIENLIEQGNNLRKQNQLLEQQKQTEYEKTEGLRLENSKKRMELPNVLEHDNLKLAIERADRTIKEQTYSNLSTQGEILMKDLNTYDERWSAELNILKQRYENLTYEGKVLIAEEALKQAQKKLAESGVNLNRAQIENYDSQTALNKLDKWFKEWRKTRSESSGMDPEMDPMFKLVLGIACHYLGIQINPDGSITALPDAPRPPRVHNGRITDPYWDATHPNYDQYRY